jgi:Papain family cysteine protease
MSVKSEVATPKLGDLVSEKSYRRLRALSVNTVEELIGLIQADPNEVSEFVPDLDLPQIQADAEHLSQAPLLEAIQDLEGADFAMGAHPPEGALVEERASPEYVHEWLQEAIDQPEQEEDEPPAVNLMQCFGPVRNQGKRGTCVAHATCAVLECQHMRLREERIDLSEQYVYWDAKQNDGRPDDEGTWLRVAMPCVEREGACQEEVWPYNPTKIPGDEAQGPPPANADSDASNHLLERPRELDGRDSAAIRAVLDEGRPVGISVPVYNNWYSNPAANALGLIPMPLPNSVRKGGHAMCAMGYGWDTDFAGGGYLILRNSWGAGWATQSPVAPGYGAIPLLYIDRYGWEAWTTEE